MDRRNAPFETKRRRRSRRYRRRRHAVVSTTNLQRSLHMAAAYTMKEDCSNREGADANEKPCFPCRLSTTFGILDSFLHLSTTTRDEWFHIVEVVSLQVHRHRQFHKRLDCRTLFFVTCLVLYEHSSTAATWHGRPLGVDAMSDVDGSGARNDG